MSGRMNISKQSPFSYLQSDSRTKEEAGPRPLGGSEFEPQESGGSEFEPQESEVFRYKKHNAALGPREQVW